MKAIGQIVLTLVLVGGALATAPGCGDDGWQRFQCVDGISATTDGKDLVCEDKHGGLFGPRPVMKDAAGNVTETAETACNHCLEFVQ